MRLLCLCPFFGVFLGFAACGSDSASTPTLVAQSEATTRIGSGGGNTGRPTAQGGTTSSAPPLNSGCGDETIAASQDPANVYFVLDRSGSMRELESGQSKYDGVRTAVTHLITTTGWRLRFGATLFPSVYGNFGCDPGTEVVPLGDGDAKSFTDAGRQGPRTQTFAQALVSTPSGGTPTAATLRALTPKLAALGKNTYVVLATDGAPNCNLEKSCSAAKCIPNIESFRGCPAEANCCDPNQNADWSRGDCFDDDDTLTAVTALAAVGVKTLVLGIPGSERYAALLNSLAVAGGVPRPASPRYYAVGKVAELDDLLQTLGATVLVSCNLSLASAPTNQALTNVYFDNDVVRQNAGDGWSWAGNKQIRVSGTTCANLLSGSVRSVRVFVGCPTVIH